MTTRGATRQEREAVAGVTAQLAALGEMTLDELREKYLELFGKASRSRNKVYLKKKINWPRTIIILLI